MSSRVVNPLHDAMSTTPAFLGVTASAQSPTVYQVRMDDQGMVQARPQKWISHLKKKRLRQCSPVTDAAASILCGNITTITMPELTVLSLLPNDSTTNCTGAPMPENEQSADDTGEQLPGALSVFTPVIMIADTASTTDVAFDASLTASGVTPWLNDQHALSLDAMTQPVPSCEEVLVSESAVAATTPEENGHSARLLLTVPRPEEARTISSSSQDAVAVATTSTSIPPSSWSSTFWRVISFGFAR